MSSLSQSYTHRNSGNSESINSLEGRLPKKRVSFLAIFGQARPGTWNPRAYKFDSGSSKFLCEIFDCRKRHSKWFAPVKPSPRLMWYLYHNVFFPYQPSKVNLRSFFPCTKHHLNSMSTFAWVIWCLRPGGGDSHMKQTGMLVVSLRGVNFGFWSRLGCSGQSANILCHRGLV